MQKTKQLKFDKAYLKDRQGMGQAFPLQPQAGWRTYCERQDDHF